MEKNKKLPTAKIALGILLLALPFIFTAVGFQYGVLVCCFDFYTL